MIVKASTKSEDLAFLEEIMADDEFAGLPAATQDKLKIYKRGLWGERDTAHMIDRYFHGATNTAVIHDLRLPDGMGGFAQFDHLILNRMAELATIVELRTTQALCPRTNMTTGLFGTRASVSPRRFQIL